MHPWKLGWAPINAKNPVLFFYLFILYSGIANYGEGNGNPLQYSCLENPMDSGAW